MTPQVVTVPAGAWADAVADTWAERLQVRPDLRMCLPTGSTPGPVYRAVTARGLDWSRSSVLLLDEWGGVPRDDPATCDATLRRELLDHVGVPGAAYRAIDAWADDVAAECAAVDDLLDAHGLHLAVLGVGINGHLGMNEPGSPRDSRTRRVDLAPETRDGSVRYFDGRATPTWGITVGLADILSADEVWVLATGARKADIVRASLEGPLTEDVPASVLRDHPRCVWWLDEAAAGG